MLYPRNLICSGLFELILIFKINKNGERIDPSLEAYGSVDELKDNDCLLIRIIKHIEENSNFKINNTWYETKYEILKEE